MGSSARGSARKLRDWEPLSIKKYRRFTNKYCNEILNALQTHKTQIKIKPVNTDKNWYKKRAC